MRFHVLRQPQSKECGTVCLFSAEKCEDTGEQPDKVFSILNNNFEHYFHP